MSDYISDLLTQAVILAERRGTTVYIYQEEDGNLNAGLDPTKGHVLEMVNPSGINSRALLNRICAATSQAEIAHEIALARKYLGWKS